MNEDVQYLPIKKLVDFPAKRHSFVPINQSSSRLRRGEVTQVPGSIKVAEGAPPIAALGTGIDHCRITDPEMVNVRNTEVNLKKKTLVFIELIFVLYIYIGRYVRHIQCATIYKNVPVLPIFVHQQLVQPNAEEASTKLSNKGLLKFIRLRQLKLVEVSHFPI